jgi:hypothetical protein
MAIGSAPATTQESFNSNETLAFEEQGSHFVFT